MYEHTFGRSFADVVSLDMHEYMSKIEMLKFAVVGESYKL